MRGKSCAPEFNRHVSALRAAGTDPRQSLTRHVFPLTFDGDIQASIWERWAITTFKTSVDEGGFNVAKGGDVIDMWERYGAISQARLKALRDDPAWISWRLGVYRKANKQMWKAPTTKLKAAAIRNAVAARAARPAGWGKRAAITRWKNWRKNGVPEGALKWLALGRVKGAFTEIRRRAIRKAIESNKRPTMVEWKIFPSRKEAGLFLGLSGEAVHFRIRSGKYSGYGYVDEQR